MKIKKKKKIHSIKIIINSILSEKSSAERSIKKLLKKYMTMKINYHIEKIMK